MESIYKQNMPSCKNNADDKAESVHGLSGMSSAVSMRALLQINLTYQVSGLSANPESSSWLTLCLSSTFSCHRRGIEPPPDMWPDV